MRLPVLENGCPLHPAAYTLCRRLQPLSSAELVVQTEEGAGLLPGTWVRLPMPEGKTEVYRVVRTTLKEAAGTVRLQLQHGLCSLSDALLTGSRTYAAGTPVRVVLAGLLSAEGTPRWAADTGMQAVTSAALRFEDENLLTALLRVPEALPGTWRWAFDQETQPWQLRLEPEEQEVSCTLCSGLDVIDAQISRDLGAMVTTLLPLGRDNMDISSVNGGDRLLSTASPTGESITRIYRDTQSATPAALKLAAQNVLTQQNSPGLQITVRAMLPEPVRPGDVCTLRLQHSSHTGVVTQVRYPDMVQSTQEAELTLCSSPPSLLDAILHRRRLQ